MLTLFFRFHCIQIRFTFNFYFNFGRKGLDISRIKYWIELNIIYLINYRIQHIGHFVTLQQNYSLLLKDYIIKTIKAIGQTEKHKLYDKPNRTNARKDNINAR